MLQRDNLLSGSTIRLMQEFKTLGIPCDIVDDELNLITYQTKAGVWRVLKGMVSEKLPVMSKFACDDKWWTYKIFQELQLPTPKTYRYKETFSVHENFSAEETFVIKPRYGAHGFGVQLNVTTNSTDAAVSNARKFDKSLLVQQQLYGRDLRILVVGDKIISAVERVPAYVIGDGIHTVLELIELENKREERGEVGVDALIKISIPAAQQYLSKEQLHTIPKNNEKIRVVGPANQSLGGTIVNALDAVTPQLSEHVIKVTSHLKMPIAGVDVILTVDGPFFLEINAAPGIWIHDDNFAGVTSGCFRAYAELLFED